MAAPAPLLSVEDLSVEFRTRDGLVKALDRVSFDIHRGETVGVVGESGSGKSVTAFAIMRILDPAARITGAGSPSTASTWWPRASRSSKLVAGVICR
jgi:ABC-type dipeptide/oligopeptide/nickel transport system, ATPase component